MVSDHPIDFLVTDSILQINLKSTPEYNVEYLEGIRKIEGINVISVFETENNDLIEVKIKLVV